MKKFTMDQVTSGHVTPVRVAKPCLEHNLTWESLGLFNLAMGNFGGKAMLFCIEQSYFNLTVMSSITIA